MTAGRRLAEDLEAARYDLEVRVVVSCEEDRTEEGEEERTRRIFLLLC
jgi:hypothetical protein